MQRTTNHKRVLFLLLGLAGVLIVMHLVLMFWTQTLGRSSIINFTSDFDLNPAYWFNLDYEKRFGAGFSTLIMVIAAGLMAYAGLRAWPKKVLAVGWVLVAGVMFFMACDEWFSIHEEAGNYFGVEGIWGTSAVPNWVKVMAIVVGLMMIPMGLFWWQLPKGLKIRTALSAGVFLGGAMGVEIIGSSFVMRYGTESFIYYCIAALEEGMEMLGILILIDAMLLHLTGRMAGPDAERGQSRINCDHSDPTADVLVDGRVNP